MFILKSIVENAGECGREFLTNEFIQPKYDGFLHAYEFDDNGNIIKQTPRHFTERSNNEIVRFTRIAFESVYDYSEKGNRHLSPDLTDDERAELCRLCVNISGGDFPACHKQLKQLVSRIEKRIIQTTIIQTC